MRFFEEVLFFQATYNNKKIKNKNDQYTQLMSVRCWDGGGMAPVWWNALHKDPDLLASTVVRQKDFDVAVGQSVVSGRKLVS